jgi:hypothetical protein
MVNAPNHLHNHIIIDRVLTTLPCAPNVMYTPHRLSADVPPSDSVADLIHGALKIQHQWLEVSKFDVYHCREY